MKLDSWVCIAGAALLVAGCRGSAPARYADPSSGKSIVLVRGRLVLPSGEIRNGGMRINLESPSDQYRLDISAKETSFFVVKPGLYRLSPARDWLGVRQSDLTVDFNGRSYRIPFPKDLRSKTIRLEATKAGVLGIFEARLNSSPDNNHPDITLTLIDDKESRRQLVQEMVQKIMDPKLSSDFRDILVSWSMALDQALVDLQVSADAATAASSPPQSP